MSERSAVILDGPLLVYRESNGKVMRRFRVDLRTVETISTTSDLDGPTLEHYLYLAGAAWERSLFVTSREQLETISKAWDECRKAMGAKAMERTL